MCRGAIVQGAPRAGRGKPLSATSASKERKCGNESMKPSIADWKKALVRHVARNAVRRAVIERLAYGRERCWRRDLTARRAEALATVTRMGRDCLRARVGEPTRARVGGKPMISTGIGWRRQTYLGAKQGFRGHRLPRRAVPRTARTVIVMGRRILAGTTGRGGETPE